MLIREPALWRDIPVRGEILDASARELSGLDALRRVSAPPPMGRLTGLTFDGADEGTASFSLPVSAWFEWSHGGVPGGTLALAADAALGCALQSLLPAHTQYTTAEMSMTYVRPARIGSVITATGRALHMGRTLGLSAAEIVDGDGRLVGYSTSRIRIFGDAAAELRRVVARPLRRTLRLNPPASTTGPTHICAPYRARALTSANSWHAAVWRSSTRRSAAICRCHRCITCSASRRPRRRSVPRPARCR
jgi:uncharacterized protein (TIGR00369 family)